LARQGQGATAPNPAVGAVLVKAGRIIGEGFHRGPGQPHAEAVALDDARARGEDPRGASLFVSLEPCCHEGGGKRTPPCAQRVVAEGVAEVFAAVADPNPRVAGRGMALLHSAGVKVHWGPCEAEAQELISDFAVWVTARRPFVTLKWAQSLDGETTGVGSPWVTGPEARAHGHELRAAHDAVAVGAGTLRIDDPQLTVRHAPLGPGGTPRRLVFAGAQGLPAQAHVFTDDQRHLTWVVANPRGPVGDQAQRLTPGRVVPWDGQDLQALGEALLAAGFYRVFVEGGPRLLGFFLRQGWWDKVALFTAPSFLRPQAPEGEAVSLVQPQWSTWGRDSLVEGWNPASPSRTSSPPKEFACSPV